VIEEQPYHLLLLDLGVSRTKSTQNSSLLILNINRGRRKREYECIQRFGALHLLGRKLRYTINYTINYRHPKMFLFLFLAYT
jgi:hypothetical protein